MMRIIMVWAMAMTGMTAGTHAAAWKSLQGWQLDGDAQPEDGDSFKIKKAGAKRTIRLYAVDCPEIGAHFPDRKAVQAKDFGVPVQDIPAWGKKAREFTRGFLGNGFTVEVCGEKAPNDRDYAIVRDARGNRLDEALLMAGLARVDRKDKKNMAPWKEGREKVAAADEDRARGQFANKLQGLESKAKRDKQGIWKH